MEYTIEITINKPRKEVIEKFDNEENLKHWQKGLQEFTTIEGEPGQVGSVAKIKFVHKGREMEMIETITKRNFPDEFTGSYSHKAMDNEVANTFIEIDKDTTLLKSKNTFKSDALAMKLMCFLMPGLFKKQSLQYLNDFKAFVEEGKSVA
jgi:hypothetical protein